MNGCQICQAYRTKVKEPIGSYERGVLCVRCFVAQWWLPAVAH